MATITFHSMADSAYLWTAMLAADEKGVDFDLVPLALHSEEHLRLHPFGKMPVLQHGDVFLYETLAITHYIDRAFNGPPLQPADALGQAEVLRWIGIVNGYVFPVMTRFVKSVRADTAAEIAKLKAGATLPQNWNLDSFRSWLYKEPAELAAADKAQLDTLLGKSERLQTVYRMRQELAAIWGRSTASREQLLEQLQAWCKRAEDSGIKSLQEFSVRLRSYA